MNRIKKFLLAPLIFCVTGLNPAGAVSAAAYPVYRAEPGVSEEASSGGLPAPEGLPAARGFRNFRAPGMAWQKETSFSMWYDDDSLFARVRCREPFSHLLRALAEDGGRVFADDSLEFFFAPAGDEYIQLAVNPAGARWNGRSGAASRDMWDWEARTAVYGDYWEALVRVPFRLIGERPSEGDVWKFNIARNSVTVPGTLLSRAYVAASPGDERYSSWAPVAAGFGDAARFAPMEFKGELCEDGAAAAEETLNESYRAYIAAMSGDESNLVRNNFFEDGLRGWHIRRHRSGLDESTASAGARSFAMDGVLEPGEEPIFLSAHQIIPLEPDTRYIISADIKRSKSHSGTISVDVLERASADGRWTHHRVGSRMRDGEVPAGPGEWGRYTGSFKTGEEIEQGRVMLYNIHSDAKAWYDNIRVFRDDGTFAVERERGREVFLKVDFRNAAGGITVNGEAAELDSGSRAAAVIQEGINVIAVRARASGPGPGVRIRIEGHPYADGRWRGAPAPEGGGGWLEADYDDRGWETAEPDAEGYMWFGDGPGARMRQLVLWNESHHGPDRCINPPAREWGISENTVESLFKAVYSPFPYPLEDYEFIFDVPADFRMMNFMHEYELHHADNPHQERRPRNTRPSGLKEEKVFHGGEEYRRHRISYPPDRMYASGGDVATRYTILPVFLERWSGEGDRSSWYYRREANGNFTELTQRIPVRILPPVDGRMPEHIMISNFVGPPFVPASRISFEHLHALMDQSFRAGFNRWYTFFWDRERMPFFSEYYDRIAGEEKAGLVFRVNYPYLGASERRHASLPSSPRFLSRWMEDNPGSRARYWKDSDSWKTVYQFCPTYALGEGREGFLGEVLATYRMHMEALPATSVIWANFEEAPWGAGSIYGWQRRREDGSGSWCFCDRCKENFREWAGLPADADLSDGNIWNSYAEEWHTFRSWLDGEFASIPREAANALGRKYMVYSWSAHRDYWAAAGKNLDLAFVGSPGNHHADSGVQGRIDADASFMTESAGMDRGSIMGQRFFFFYPYTHSPAGSHQEYWNRWTVLSPGGYMEPESWKTQVLRIVAAFGGGVDLQGPIRAAAGSLYWIGEATRIIAEYEEIFRGGARADNLAESDVFSYPDLLVLRKGDERLVLLFNESGRPVETVLRNRDVLPGQTAAVFEAGVFSDNPSEMRVTVPARDAAAVHIR